MYSTIYVTWQSLKGRSAQTHVWYDQICKGGSISFQLVADTPCSDFPRKTTKNLTRSKNSNFSCNRDLSFFILSNFWWFWGGKSEHEVSVTIWNEIKLPLLSDSQSSFLFEQKKNQCGASQWIRHVKDWSLDLLFFACFWMLVTSFKTSNQTTYYQKKC